MQSLPHQYRVVAESVPAGWVSIASPGLPTLETAPPAEYGGPGDRWSPESLLVAAVADCFILSFRACARAGKLKWVSLKCEAEGELDRADGTTRFVAMSVRASLRGAPGMDPERARDLLERAEKTCLITNSLVCETRLHIELETAA